MSTFFFFLCSNEVKFLKFVANKIIMKRLISQCTEDMLAIAASGKYTLDQQVRAYDLLQQLIELYDGLKIPQQSEDAANRFCSVYETESSALESSFDPSALESEAAQRLKPIEDEANDMRFQAAAAASLHEFAKEVFDIWQNSGVFARRRALKELRERAGFRLESHRIGNYVAKTFDLQNEAASRFAKAQQAVYAANVSYKIRPGIYADIARHLSL